MTVKELIERLQQCDQDAVVYFDACNGAEAYDIQRVTEDQENNTVDLI